MTLATSLRATASRLMAKFGGTATIRRVTTGTYNPATGTVSEATSDVRLDDPRLVPGLNLLVSLSLLDAARPAQILFYERPQPS